LTGFGQWQRKPLSRDLDCVIHRGIRNFGFGDSAGLSGEVRCFFHGDFPKRGEVADSESVDLTHNGRAGNRVRAGIKAQARDFAMPLDNECALFLRIKE
jgi:hypothetical protein